jgi:hypothetical protein
MPHHRIDIEPMEPHHFGVQVTESDVTTSHRVFVPPAFVDDLALLDVEETSLVRATFDFLLENETVTEIEPEFALDDIAAEFGDDYYDELRARVASGE